MTTSMRVLAPHRRRPGGPHDRRLPHVVGAVVSAAEVEADLTTDGLVDWAIPCEYTAHERCGSGPAEWIVVKAPPPCGCRPSPALFHCDGCYQRRLTCGWVICNECGDPFPALSNVIRVERISRT